MSGPAESKIEIEAKVYIHKRDPSTRSKIPHIDIEAPILNEIIKPNESTFVSGKLGLHDISRLPLFLFFNPSSITPQIRGPL